MLALFWVLITVNIIITLVWWRFFKKPDRGLVIFLCTAAAMPLLGLLIIIADDYIASRRGRASANPLFEEEKAYSVRPRGIFLSDRQLLCTMPIYDMLFIKNKAKRREMLYKAVKGDCFRLHPFLLRLLKDRDPEVVHYASAAAADFRQKIQECCTLSKDEYLKNMQDPAACKAYIDSMIDYIRWEELEGTDMSEARKELECVYKGIEKST